MKYRFLVRAALVITLGLPPMVAGAQTDDFVNGLVTKIDESAGRIVIKDRIASTAISRSQRSKKPSENRISQGAVRTGGPCWSPWLHPYQHQVLGPGALQPETDRVAHAGSGVIGGSGHAKPGGPRGK
jgi:hypothetical protein